MRRALGLQAGPGVNPRPRQMDRFSQEPRKRVFSRDGDVPVTIVNSRAKQEGNALLARPLSLDPAPRHEELAQALAAERAKREQAERSLRDAQTTIHDLQTKLGHAQLALDELRAEIRAEAGSARELAAVRQETDALLSGERALRDEAEAALREERSHRRVADNALREATNARALAEERLKEAQALILTLREAKTQAPAQAVPPAPPPPPPSAAPVTAKPRRTAAVAAKPAPKPGPKPKKAAAASKQKEPQPVKWWLPSKTKKKK